jgi:FkbM family methyltransferase
MKIFYGIENCIIDVTGICLSKLKNDIIITIPSGDNNRTHYFTDPLYGVLKKIFITINETTTSYNDNVEIYINTNTYEITINNIHEKILNIHKQLVIKHGNFQEELPQQLMSVRFLTGNEKVLEIGGNIGRNSLIIASILNNDNNLVILESDTYIANQLEENKNLNHFSFSIENAALSKRKLIQKNWETIQSHILQEGYIWVNTISFNDLQKKYNIKFDTLVLHCKGAFYYILMDMPEILNNIHLIIIENDYTDISQKKYIDNILIKNNFVKIYNEFGGWGPDTPCYNNFYETWKKKYTNYIFDMF